MEHAIFAIGVAQVYYSFFVNEFPIAVLSDQSKRGPLMRLEWVKWRFLEFSSQWCHFP